MLFSVSFPNENTVGIKGYQDSLHWCFHHANTVHSRTRHSGADISLWHKHVISVAVRGINKMQCALNTESLALFSPDCHSQLTLCCSSVRESRCFKFNSFSPKYAYTRSLPAHLACTSPKTESYRLRCQQMVPKCSCVIHKWFLSTPMHFSLKCMGFCEQRGSLKAELLRMQCRGWKS